MLGMQMILPPARDKDWLTYGPTEVPWILQEVSVFPLTSPWLLIAFLRASLSLLEAFNISPTLYAMILAGHDGTRHHVGQDSTSCVMAPLVWQAFLHMWAFSVKSPAFNFVKEFQRFLV